MSATGDAQSLAVAARLIADEGGGGEALVRIYERYFDSLAPIIGARGVRALFARAVWLEKARHASLAALALDADARGAAAELALGLKDQPPDVVRAAAVATLGGFLCLVVAILGADLAAEIMGAELREIR